MAKQLGRIPLVGDRVIVNDTKGRLKSRRYDEARGWIATVLVEDNAWLTAEIECPDELVMLTPRRLRPTWLMVAVAVIAGVAGGIVATSSLDDHLGALYPCSTEDSEHCYWDADTMGNGQGSDQVYLSFDSSSPADNPEGIPACTDAIADAHGICKGEPK